MKNPVTGMVSIWRLILSYLLVVLLAWQPLLPVLAAVITPANGSTQTLSAGNGVPVVNIATPNQAGLSHNKYQQFNVGGEGLILNNATGKLTQTQLGGLILNNPNLQAGQEAKAIINEVVGANPSQLQGYMEVAGKAASVMVANPYGITCNGCGFINTPNATLTTGSPVIGADGNLQSLEVTQGAITIEGKGLDASQSDAFSLLARAAQINAGLYAKSLTVAVGANHIDAAGNATPLGTPDNMPTIAVDTGALGGMYANSIRLVSSDKGVGVNLGNLSAAAGGIALSASGALTVTNAVANNGAAAGDINLSASGKLTVNNASAQGSLSASGSGLQLGGNVAAQGNMVLGSQGDLETDNATLAAGGNLQLNAAGHLGINNSRLDAGTDSAGNIGEQGNLSLTGATVSLTGSHGAAAMASVTAGGAMMMDVASLLQARQLSLSGQQLQLDGQLASNQDLTITGTSLTGGTGAAISSQQNINLNLGGVSLWNGQMLAGTGLHFQGGVLTNGGQLLAVNDLSVNGTALNNNGLIQAADLSFTGGSLNNAGRLQAQNSVTLAAGSLIQQATASLTAGGQLKVQAANADTDGIWQSQSLDYQGGDWHNAGSINSLANMDITLNGVGQNSGNLLAADQLALTAPQFTNLGLLQGQQIAVSGGGQTTSQGGGTFANSGTLRAVDSLTLDGLDSLSNSGALLSGGLSQFSAVRLTNGGTITAAALQATGASLSNSGTLNVAGALAFNGGDAANSGDISAGQTLFGGHTLNNTGNIVSGGSLAINVDQLTNGGALTSDSLSFSGQVLTNGGTMDIAQGADIQASQWQNNGTFRAGQVSAAGQSLFNSGELTGSDQLVLGFDAGVNNSGVLATNGPLSLTARVLINSGTLSGATNLTLSMVSLQNQGNILAGGAGNITGASVVNSGQLQAGQLQIAAGTLDNSGTLLGQDGLTLALLDTLQNQNEGQILSAGPARLTAAAITNAGALQAESLRLTAGELDNSGHIQGDNQLSLRLGQQEDSAVWASAAAPVAIGVLNNQGGIISDGAASLQLAQLNNQGSVQGQTLVVQGNQLQNSGTLISPGDLDVTLTGALSNLASGQVLTDALLNIAAGSVSNQGLMQGGTLTATAASLDNQGQLQGTQGLTFNTDGAQTYGADSRLLSNGTAALSAQDITTAGLWQADELNITADRLDNSGAMVGLTSLTIHSSGQLNNLLTGQLLSNGDITLQGGQIANNGQIQGETLTLNGGTLDNEGSLTGLDQLALTLDGALSSSGKLLTNGTGTLTAGQFTHSGFAQAQQWNITAASLDNSGILAGIGGLWLSLTNSAQNQSQGQLLSNGASQIQAADFTNSGLWQAASLLLNANSAANQGTLQGTGQVVLTLLNGYSGALGSMLATGEQAVLSAATFSNAGTLQAQQLHLSAGSLTNSGTLQGTGLLDLQLTGDLANSAGASLLGADQLQLRAAHITNQGIVQGGDVSVNGTALDNSGTMQGNQTLGLTLTGQLNNLAGGQILSGGQTSLLADQLNNDGWLQSQQLTYSGSQFSNNGTLLAGDLLQLTVPTFTNQGTLQGGRATIDSTMLNNDGTLLGITSLALQSGAINNQSGGRIYSAKDLSFTSASLQQNGQFLALGNLNGHITGALDFTSLLAAGQTLTLNADGDFSQQGTLQGNAVQLTAGGTFTNSGQVVTGNGGLSVTAATINQPSGGSLQSGAAVTLTSNNNITNQGFIGTLGNLLLQTAATLTNTGLLYSGGNMQLLADSIQNISGDILAGNGLWMQRDAAGDANSQIVNSSGDIETQNGDITLNTGLLLNQRQGFSVTQTDTTLAVPAWANGASILIPADWFQPGDIGVSDYGDTIGGGSPGHGGGGSYVTTYWYVPYASAYVQDIAVAETTFSVTSGGNAGRLVAGGNIVGYAGSLNNIASNILAGGNITLSGNSLNNLSYQEGTTTEYQQYHYAVLDTTPGDEIDPPMLTLDEAPAYFTSDDRFADRYTSDSIAYTAVGAPTYTYTGGGQNYNALIQAGGYISASFSQDISNTTVAPDIGGITHQLTAPSLTAINALAGQSQQSSRQLAATDDGFTLAGSVLDPQTVNGGQNGNLALNQGSAANSAQGLSAADGGAKSLASAPGPDAPLSTLTPAQLSAAIATGLKPLTENPLADYPLPAGNDGLFVINSQPGSHYLITANPKLTQLGQVNGSVFNDLNSLLGQPPITSPTVETSSQLTNEQQFDGSAYLLNKLNLNADTDYQFLGDAEFDTQYVDNAVISQAGQRYINGVGSDLQQMQTLLDNAASEQQALNLQFGVSLTPDQVAGLTQSIVWYVPITVDGQTVLAPQLYLAQADETNLQGSVITASQVGLASAGSITNSGAVTAVSLLDMTSQDQIINQNGGLLKSDGSLDLTALNTISNLSSAISGGNISLTSLNGSIVNQTASDTWSVGSLTSPAVGGSIQAALTATETGDMASISATGDLVLSAAKDISVVGASVASGGDTVLAAGNDITITALSQTATDSTLTGRQTNDSRQTTAQSGTITAGGALSILAGNDLTLNGSGLTSGADMQLAAGNDLNLEATATGTQNNSQSDRSGQESQDHTLGGVVSSLDSVGNLSLTAGQDITSQGASLNAAESVALSAGGDITLDALQSDTYSESHGDNSENIDETIGQQGTAITAGSGIQLTAGQDITLAATQAQAGGAIGLDAGGDITLDTAQESDYHYDEATHTSSGLFSSTSTHTVDEDYDTHQLGSLLSGDSVNLSAGNDIGITGSSVIGDDHVTLQAGNDITIAAATEEQSSYQLKETETSGMFSGGGFGVTFGSTSMRDEIDQNGTTQSQSVSTIGATDGNVNIIAGGTAHLSEAQVIAGDNLNVVAGAITIDQGDDLLNRRESYEQQQSGLTIAISSPITDALTTMDNLADKAGQTSDARMDALYGVEALHDGWAASQNGGVATQASQIAKGDYDASVKLQISVGASQSSSLSTLAEQQAAGSTLSAGGDVTLVATGGNNQSGDLLITGSGITGDNVTLAANHDLILDAAASTSDQHSSSDSSGWNVGVSVSLGASTGIGVFANGYMASDNADGSTTDYLNTRVNAQNQLSLSSGGDTVLEGAQALGNSIIANVGGDLTITSLQDTDDYQESQKSVSGGLSISFGTMPVSGSLSISGSNINSQYASVGAQSGLFAGDQGYDIHVGDHTQLNGAVIASTAAAADNQLSTGTLGWDAIQNAADYSATGYGFSAGAGGGASPFALPALSDSQSGSASGTSSSAIADGTLTIRDPGAQQQDVATLSHDTADANGHIDEIFDKEQVEQNLAFTQEVGQVSMGVVQDVMQYQLSSAADAARAGLQQSDPNFNSLSPEAQQQEIEQTAVYKTAQSEYGIGGTYAILGDAISGALTGLAGGDLTQAAAGALAPYLSQVVKIATTDPDTKQVNVPENALGHALVGGLVAYLQGNSAAGGAAGGAGGELAAEAITAELYPGVATRDLTEEQKQTISTLSTLAAGLAGTVAGNSAAGAVTGADAGKNAVDNNYLSATDKSRQTELDYKQNLTPQEQTELDALNLKDAETSKALVDACMNGSASACAAARQDALNVQDTYQNLGYQDQKETQAGYQQIQALLTGTSEEAKQTQELFNSMVVAYMGAGMSEESAESAVGYQLGAMYAIGGIAGIGLGEVADDGLTLSEEPALQLLQPDVNNATEINQQVSPATPTGSKGNPLDVPAGTNKSAVIDGLEYSGHSLDRMQKQGITPTVVENAINPENAVQGKNPGTIAYHDNINNLTVITDEKSGRVITVDFGIIKQ
ncbi:hemagglutinin repeat-containing protein [Sodalis sp. dw_96]|uniref:hemagglutinin repeat-containing protein n=1 Tax=Sodalis sp. dw_96 TaxID=2719794 RepID=UPI001BD51E9D|nr:hemagglutinin repeat-containing protein [Sodalis sp. dw_96]